MRNIPVSMQQSLNSGATTLCNCWAISRLDGVVMGFTDHDVDLNFDGLTYTANSALDASSYETSAGLSIDNQQAAGALRSDAITESDIHSGAYDSARVDLYRVDWQNPDDRVLLFSGEIGEIERNNLSFKAELRGMAHRLNQPIGRAYLYSCDAALGDNKCQVDLTDNTYSAEAAVVSIQSNRRFIVSGLDQFSPDWFSRGLIKWLSGDNKGQSLRIKFHAFEGDNIVIETWTLPANNLQSGDRFSIIAGCNKHFKTCRVKFANAANFRGFPHFPGDDWAASYPNRGEGHDGSSLRRG